jgi:hypothetical protein
MVELVRGDRVLARWPLTVTRADLSAIETLARLQVAARRWDCAIRLRGPCSRLSELLDLTGLDQILTTADGLAVEVSREPEGGEEVDVEEGMDPGNETP